MELEYEGLKQAKRHFSRLGLMYFLGTLIIYGFQFGELILIGIWKPGILDNSDLYLIAVMLPMYLITMPLMALLVSTVPSVGIRRRDMTAGQWFISFLMCYAIVYLSNIIGQAITMAIGLIKGEPVANAILDITNGLSPWASVLIMVLLAPAAEEMIFRKLLIDRAVRFGEGCAILLSGVIFGLFHGNLNQFAYAFTLGLFLGFLYVKTGKIIYTIFLHMAINLSSVISLILVEYSGFEEITLSVGSPEKMMGFLLSHLIPFFLFVLYVFILFGFVIAGIVLLIVNAKNFVTYPGEMMIPAGKLFSTVFLNVGMILFSLFWIIQIIIQLFQ